MVGPALWRLLLLLLVVGLFVFFTGRYGFHPFLVFWTLSLTFGAALPTLGFFDSMDEGAKVWFKDSGITTILCLLTGTFLSRSGGLTILTRRLYSTFGSRHGPLVASLFSLLAMVVDSNTMFLLFGPLTINYSLMCNENPSFALVAFALSLLSVGLSVPPSPGPVATANSIKAPIWTAVAFGLPIALVQVSLAWLWSYFVASKFHIKLPQETGDNSPTDTLPSTEINNGDENSTRPENSEYFYSGTNISASRRRRRKASGNIARILSHRRSNSDNTVNTHNTILNSTHNYLKHTTKRRSNSGGELESEMKSGRSLSHGPAFQKRIYRTAMSDSGNYGMRETFVTPTFGDSPNDSDSEQRSGYTVSMSGSDESTTGENSRSRENSREFSGRGRGGFPSMHSSDPGPSLTQIEASSTTNVHRGNSLDVEPTCSPGNSENGNDSQKICIGNQDYDASSDSYDFDSGPLAATDIKPSLQLSSSDKTWFLAAGTDFRSSPPSFSTSAALLIVPVVMMIFGSLFHCLGTFVPPALLVFFETMGGPLISLTLASFISFSLPEVKSRRMASVEGEIGHALKMSATLILNTLGAAILASVARHTMDFSELVTSFPAEAGILAPMATAFIIKFFMGLPSADSMLFTSIAINGSLHKWGIVSDVGLGLTVVGIGAGTLAASHVTDSFFWLVVELTRYDMFRMLLIFKLGNFLIGLVTCFLVWLLYVNLAAGICIMSVIIGFALCFVFFVACCSKRLMGRKPSKFLSLLGV